MNAYVGEVRLFAYGFAPPPWEPCNGANLRILDFPALFGVIGTRFGGDGKLNFALPDLRLARVALGAGAGPGLTSRAIGEVGGLGRVTLDTTTIPSHTHLVYAVGEPADVLIPTAETALARSNSSSAYRAMPVKSEEIAKLAPTVIGPAPGGNQSHENQMPYLALYYAIYTR